MAPSSSTFSIDAVQRLSNPAKLNATGLVLTALGMLLQIAAGSTLYPSYAGPIVLLGTAIIVLFGPVRWTPYIGLLIPLVLGVGATIAALMTGGFVDQLTDPGRTGIFVGSVLHVLGLVAAVTGGIGMVLGRRAGEHER